MIILDEFCFIEDRGLVSCEFINTVSDETKVFKLVIDPTLLSNDLVDFEKIKSQILMYTLSHEKMTLIICDDTDNTISMFDAFRTGWYQSKDSEFLELKFIVIKI